MLQDIANAAGYRKLSLFVGGKSAKPNAFINVNSIAIAVY